MDLSKPSELTDEHEAKSTSVADTLAGNLQRAILKGDFAVGSSLPSERELMANFGVSRTTVREALRILGAHGLVEVRRGRRGGSYVSNERSNSLLKSLDLFIKNQDIRFIDLVFAREGIEPAAAAQAAITCTREQLADLKFHSEECERQCEDFAGFVEANLKWHTSVARASNNPLFLAILTSLTTALHTATNREDFDVATRRAVVGVHWQIYEAIRAGDPNAARRRMARHITAYREKLSASNLEDRDPDYAA
ncbi:FadR/GntR family transcriptional regulator [Bosea sp. (in: a-proteobacteria)]|uniref:FadR/GntR family transcriptional regulator n=1 Tax=Bosea sp. (in: a-proteobacteria) TaxID=1871050 RepID=UPI00260FC50E|nr:FadR/GntR family transcriptional regulator [Bosea sp. (in: a-proteobacteria)]MCO5090034.1 FadR family transcriptional regulator [Bosea sp. (in: a-proteobacteria)]